MRKFVFDKGCWTLGQDGYCSLSGWTEFPVLESTPETLFSKQSSVRVWGVGVAFIMSQNIQPQHTDSWPLLFLIKWSLCYQTLMPFLLSYKSPWQLIILSAQLLPALSATCRDGSSIRHIMRRIAGVRVCLCKNEQWGPACFRWRRAEKAVFR